MNYFLQIMRLLVLMNIGNVSLVRSMAHLFRQESIVNLSSRVMQLTRAQAGIINNKKFDQTASYSYSSGEDRSGKSRGQSSHAHTEKKDSWEEKDYYDQEKMRNDFLKIFLLTGALSGVSILQATHLDDDDSEKFIKKMTEQDKALFCNYLAFLIEYILYEGTPVSFMSIDSRGASAHKDFLHEHNLFTHDFHLDQFDGYFFPATIREELKKIGINEVVLRDEFLRGGFYFLKKDFDYCLFEYKQALCAGCPERYFWDLDYSFMRILKHFPSLEPLVVRYLCKDLELLIAKIQEPAHFVSPHFFSGYIRYLSPQSHDFLIKSSLQASPPQYREEYQAQWLRAFQESQKQVKE